MTDEKFTLPSMRAHRICAACGAKNYCVEACDHGSVMYIVNRDDIEAEVFR